MTRWTRRLPVRAALAAGAGALAGAALMQGLALGLGVMPPGGLLGGATVGAAIAAGWWGSLHARTLRTAMDVAQSAMPGRALMPAGNESVAVAHLMRTLVDRAEQSTRELSQRQAFAAVSEFAGELARELAPSVASARSAIRTAEGALHLDSPFRLPLARAQRELHRMSNTLQDTQRLARSGRLDPQRIDLWQPLRTALRVVASDALARSVRLDTPTFSAVPLWVQGDRDALEQLFINLLLNAVQATESGGRVSLEVQGVQDVMVTIADTGCGIPDGALDRVFEPFYSTKADRAGLGLAIAWRTAAAHGGRLAIESALGRGTRVQLVLPAADRAGAFALE